MVSNFRRIAGWVVLPLGVVCSASTYASTGSAAANGDWIGPALLMWLAVVVLGCIQGLRRKVVVFSSFQDLYLTFGAAVVCIAVPMVFGIGAKGGGALSVVSLLIVVAVLAAVAWATWRANRGVLGFVLAYATKLSVSLLLVLKVFELVSPSGRTNEDRRQARIGSLLTTLLIVPLVFGLVAEHGASGEAQ